MRQYFNLLSASVIQDCRGMLHMLPVLDSYRAFCASVAILLLRLSCVQNEPGLAYISENFYRLHSVNYNGIDSGNIHPVDFDNLIRHYCAEHYMCH